MKENRKIPSHLAFLFVLIGFYFLYLGTVEGHSLHRFLSTPKTWYVTSRKASSIVMEGNGSLKHDFNERISLKKTALKEQSNASQIMTADRIRELIHDTIAEVFTTLNSLGEQHGWDFQNPADYDLIKTALESVVSDTFATRELQILAESYYCNCDISFRPLYTGPVGFRLQQPVEHLIFATVLEPASSMDNNAYLWTVALLYADERWKLHQLTRTPIGTHDLQLTITEAEQLLEYEYRGDAIFVKTYDSREAGGSVYLFKIVTANTEFYRAIRPRDTKLVDDFSL